MNTSERLCWYTGELCCCDSCRDNDFYPVVTDGRRLWMKCDKCGFTKYCTVEYGSSTGLGTDRVHTEPRMDSPIRRR